MFPRILKKFYYCIVKLFIFLNSILWYFLYCNYSVCSYEFMAVSSVIIFRLSYMVKKKVKCVEISACSTILHIPDVYILQISDSFLGVVSLGFSVLSIFRFDYSAIEFAIIFSRNGELSCDIYQYFFSY